MKREIYDVTNPGRCCPGHDNFPNETYRDARSIRARSQHKKKEHRYVRRVKEQMLIEKLLRSTKGYDESFTLTRK